MVLEPGSTVPYHRDSDNSISLVIHCAVDYPVGSGYFVQPKGKCSEQVPLFNGSCFLMDVSKPHAVFNRSSLPRISLIIEGPVNFSQHKLITLARQQNGFLSYADLISASLRTQISRQ